MRAEPSRAAPGETFQLKGLFFFVECYDTGQGKRENPDRDIRLEFRQGERTWYLATVDANPDYTFDLEIIVPPDATHGQAAIVAYSSSGPTEAGLTVTALPDTGGRRAIR